MSCCHDCCVEMDMENKIPLNLLFSLAPAIAGVPTIVSSDTGVVEIGDLESNGNHYYELRSVGPGKAAVTCTFPDGTRDILCVRVGPQGPFCLSPGDPIPLSGG